MNAFFPRLATHRAARRLPILAALALAACTPSPPLTRFQVDLCGRDLQWQRQDTYWEALYVAQLPHHDELTLSMQVPREVQRQDLPPEPATLQFQLITEPGALQVDNVRQLVRRYALQPYVTPSQQPPKRAIGTGFVTAFREDGLAWQGGPGELELTDVQVHARGKAGNLASMSGRFRFEVQPQGAGAARCTVHGSFQDASFKLQH